MRCLPSYRLSKATAGNRSGLLFAVSPAMRRSAFSLILCLLSALTLLCPASALAACGAGDAVWNGGIGNWSNINFWTTTGTNPPNSPTQSVCIDNGNAIHSIVSLDTGVATINNLTLDSGDSLFVLAGNILNAFGSINSAGSTGVQGSLQAPSFTNTGTVATSGLGALNVGSYTQTSGTTTVGGSGLVAGSYTQVAGDTIIQSGSSIAMGNGGTFTLNGGTLQVTGDLTPVTGSFSFQNNGATVNVNGILFPGNGGSYTQTNGSTTINSGGDLTIGGAGSYTQVAGVTLVGAGGILRVADGGTFAASGGSVQVDGMLTPAFGSFNFQNNGAAIAVNHFAAISTGATGTYTQSSGTTTINSGGELGTDKFTQTNGSTTINSGGDLTVRGSYTQVAGVTLVGAGGTLRVVSGGTFSASGGSVQVDGILTYVNLGTPSFNFQNNGATVNVNGGGQLNAGTGSYTQTSGVTRVDGQLTAALVTIGSGSTLLGTGTITGSVSNAGSIRPGDPGFPGFLLISGNYGQSNTGMFLEDLSTLGNGALVTGGGAFLSGALNVNVLNGFVPLTNTPYEILSYDSLFGTFGTINLFGDPNQTVSVDYNFLSGNLVAIEFQNSTPPPPPPVPEPASLVLFGIGLLAISYRGIAWRCKKNRVLKTRSR